MEICDLIMVFLLETRLYGGPLGAECRHTDKAGGARIKQFAHHLTSLLKFVLSLLYAF